MVKRDNSPCFTCVKRCLLCHAHCDEYAEWVQRQRENKVRDGGYDADNFLRDQSQKRQRKYNPKGKRQ